jgi:hypothetical protein
MKTPIVIGLVALAVLITVAIEETRIASIRAGIKTEENIAATPTKSAAAGPTIESGGASSGEITPPVRTKSRADLKPAAHAKPATSDQESDDESFAKTARKMWDNPAGKSMMNQGVKMAVSMMYQDFIDDLDLTKEETEYFKNLLGKEMAGQQELGMKLLGATPDEQKALAEELAQRGRDQEEEIKKFLNSEEDYKKYTDYKNHLPERQQLDGIRATMSSKGVALDEETETRLVDAMYRARTESKVPDYSGPGGIEEMMKGNMVEAFEKSWASQQETLKVEAAKVLNEDQMAAFQEYQQQAKEMQLMGLKMAEKMMPGKKDAPN